MSTNTIKELSMKSYQAIYRDLCDTICDAKDLDEGDLSPEVSLQ